MWCNSLEIHTVSYLFIFFKWNCCREWEPYRLWQQGPGPTFISRQGGSPPSPHFVYRFAYMGDTLLKLARYFNIMFGTSSFSWVPKYKHVGLRNEVVNHLFMTCCALKWKEEYYICGKPHINCCLLYKLTMHSQLLEPL